jgi:2-polyprenyl-3-methyl-5-hydroxy-6-metoxy-1,4-benzoquinol methylase
MHVAIFLMDNLDSLEMTRPLLIALRSLNIRVTLVHYWSEDLFPVEDLVEHGVDYLTLSDGGFGTIPRLSRAQYQALCGNDIDFVSCQYHNLAVRNFPRTREMLYTDSMYHQRFYGLAYRAECTLRALSPDVAIVNHGSETISRLLYAKCRKLGVPVTLSESSFVPGRLLIDPVGMHFFPGENRIERDWAAWRRDTPLDDLQCTRLESYLAGWRQSQTSKYPQSEAASEREGLERWLANDPMRRRTVLVVDQLPWDANILNGCRGFDTFGAMLDAAHEHLPPRWRAVFKRHPRNPETESASTGETSPGWYTVRDVGLHTLLERADAVLTYSSNVGLEAIAYGRPVIVAGRPHYADKGLTLELDHAQALPARLDDALRFCPDPSLRERYLHAAWLDYLIDPAEPGALLARLDEARAIASKPKVDAPQRPFAACQPVSFASYAAESAEYDRLAGENLSHDQIMERLDAGRPLPESAVEAWTRLASGERQVAFDLTGVADNHRIRYSLMRRLVAAGQNVLDFTCGTGYGSLLLGGGTGARVTGVDASGDAIAFARDFFESPGIAYAHESAGSFRFGSATHDLVVSFETIEHLANDQRFVDQLWESLRPGGVLAVSVPNLEEYPMRGHVFHVRHYAPKSLTRLMETLPGAAWTRIIGQVEDRRLVARAAGKHLIGLVGKAGPGLIDPVRIDRLLPYTTIDHPEVLAPRLRFRTNRFLYNRDVRPATVMRLDISGDSGCPVFGPCAKLRAGTYRAEFLMGLDSSAEVSKFEGCRLVADVMTNSCRVYARRDFVLPELSGLVGARRRVAVEFEHPDGAELVQLRVRIEGPPIPATLVFEGVDLFPISNGVQVSPASREPAMVRADSTTRWAGPHAGVGVERTDSARR